MTPEQHTFLSKRAGDFKRVDKTLRAMENRTRQFQRLGWPDMEAEATFAVLIEYLRTSLDALSVEIADIVSETELAGWIEETKGIGAHGIGLCVGLLPLPQSIGSVRATWALLGIHIGEGGTAVRRKRGEWSGFDPLLRAYALYRASAAAWRAGDYRHVYLARRAHTLTTHPPMFVDDEPKRGLTDPDCLTCRKAIAKSKKEREAHEYSRIRKAPRYDCSNLSQNGEGRHWTKGHRHHDAIRVTAKEIFKDLWRVAHDQPPLLGHRSDESHESHGGTSREGAA